MGNACPFRAGVKNSALIRALFGWYLSKTLSKSGYIICLCRAHALKSKASLRGAKRVIWCIISRSRCIKN